MFKIKNIFLKESFLLFLIFSIAFLARAGYSFYEKVPPYVDARHYDNLGLNISMGNGYTDKIDKIVVMDEEALAWPPLYPFFLAFIYKIFGHSYPAVWIIQAVIGAGSCILVYFLARMAFNQKVAIVSAIINAFCFDIIIYTGMLLSETIYIFLVLACLFCFFKQRYWMAGILAGLSALARPIIMVFYLILLLWGLKERRRIKNIPVFFFFLSLIISPWIIRNYFVYHQFIPIAGSAGENLWIGNNPETNGDSLKSGDKIEEMFRNARNNYLELNSLGLKNGLRFMARNPERVFLLSLKKMSVFWSPLRTNGWWLHMEGMDRKISIVMSFLFNFFIFSFGILGLVFSFSEKSLPRFWLRNFIFICALSLIPFSISVRYRFPAYSVMIIFASYGICLLLQPARKIVLERYLFKRYILVSLILVAVFIVNFSYDFMVNLNEINIRLKGL